MGVKRAARKEKKSGRQGLKNKADGDLEAKIKKCFMQDELVHKLLRVRVTL